MTFVDHFAGSAGGCSNGGAIYAAGNPPVHTYVCNGTNGIDGEDGAAGTRADGPCLDNFNRYVDCGNGTVTDTVTGLIWLKDAACLGLELWAAANQSAAALHDGQCGLADGSSAGDWRLPTKDEWSATTARAAAMGCTSSQPGGFPTLTNNAGTACYGAGAGLSFTGMAPAYGSATGAENLPAAAWFVYLTSGGVDRGFKSGIGDDGNNPLSVWPVRGGPR